MYKWIHRFVVLAILVCTTQAFTQNIPALYAPPLPAVDDAGAHHFANGAEMLGDITYESIDGYRPVKLDLYLPSAQLSKQPLPLVVWVHGGGWSIGNPRADWTYGDWTQVLARLSARGYAVAAISYRLNNEARFPAQIDDIHAALQFLRKNSSRWAIDSNRVYIWGLSAGGHLASLTGMQSAEANPENRVQGVVNWFGPTDFTALGPVGSTSPISVLLGCPATGCSKEALSKASPVTYVSAKAPPTLIMQGDADPLVAPAQAQELYDRLHAAGAEVKIVRYPGLGHGFTGAPEAKLQEILETTFSFFDQLSHAAKP